MTSSRALRPLTLLLAFAGLATQLSAATITNSSFETDTNYVTWPGYQSANNGGLMTGWTSSNATRTGINASPPVFVPANTSPFANNGAIPNGTQAAFIQVATANPNASLSNTITGLVAGQVYRLTWRMAARNNGTAANQKPNGTVTVGTTSVNFGTAPVDAAGTFTSSYRTGVLTFTATGSTETLTVSAGLIAGQTDSTMVIDAFSVADAVATKWTTSAWTNDATSGIVPGLTYTHAYSFGTAVGAVATNINGVNFSAAAGANPSLAGSFSTTGWGNQLDDAVNNISTGGSAALADSMLYGGTQSAQTLTLQGLTVGTPYRLTLYGVGWDDAASPNRTMLFDDGANDLVILNEQQFGIDNGIRVELEYTPTAASKTFTLNPTGTPTTFHLYGFANASLVPEVSSSTALALAALSLTTRRRRRSA